MSASERRYTLHHRSFEKIGYKIGIDKGGIKYLEKKYEGV